MPNAVKSRYISPSTGRYVVSAGGYQEDSSVASKVVLALRTRRGTAAVYPTFGSRLHEIRKADESGRRSAEKFARQALIHLARQVESLDVEAQLLGKGIIGITVSAKQNGRVVVVSYTQVVGSVLA